MLTIVAAILLATCCGASAYPDTGPELEKIADIDAYWCNDTNEAQCIVNRENMAQECKTYCEEAFTSVDEFILKYNRTYANEAEAKQRMAIFAENYVRIKEHNKLYELGKSTYKMGINKFADISYEEFVNNFTGENEEDLDHRKRFYYSLDLYVPTDLGKEPKYLDYRDEGALNPIRDQDRSNSCWAFAAVASIESNLFIKTGKLLQLSERDLVDCEVRKAKEGRGWAWKGIEGTIERGIAYRNEYPYTLEDGPCRNVNRIYPVAKVQRIAHNESHLLNALVHVGPIAVSIKVTQNFRFYTGGDFEGDDECPYEGVKIGHDVLLVGYGTDNGKDYWLIRNSWGDDVGEKGYYKMARNVKNNCGITTQGFVTIIKESLDCEGKEPDCPLLKKHCNICHKTCNTCPNEPPLDCKDNIPGCHLLKRFCNNSQIKKDCHKTCNICSTA